MIQKIKAFFKNLPGFLKALAQALLTLLITIVRGTIALIRQIPSWLKALWAWLRVTLPKVWAWLKAVPGWLKINVPKFWAWIKDYKARWADIKAIPRDWRFYRDKAVLIGQDLKVRFFRFEAKYPRRAKYLTFFTYASFLGSVVLVFALYIVSFTLPSLSILDNPEYELPTQVYDRHGQLVTEFYIQRRVLVPIEEVPPQMKNALMAIEDSRFYLHFGIDPIRIMKAAIVDLSCLCVREGASTLTQQTAKMFLLSSDRKIIRKMKEALLALRMEARYSKDEILELYLNKAYFGHGAYGIEAAAQGYFSKNTKDLNLSEIALLAGLPQAPTAWAPTNSIKNATRRRNLVLRAMYSNGYITEEEMEEALASPIRLRLGGDKDNNETSYFTEWVRRYVINKYGMELLYQGGLQVHTTMDLEQQVAAQAALSKGLEEHDKRQGYRGAITNLWQEVDRLKRRKAYKDQKPKDLYNLKLKEATNRNKFVLGGRVQGVVTEVGQERVVVNLGAFKGSMGLKENEWARPVNKEVSFYYERLNDFRRILKNGDVIEANLLDYDENQKSFNLGLYQKPEANGGIYVVDPRTMEVLAISGGYDFRDSEFNRAIQSKRQPGSAFKPIIYSLAFQQNYTRATLLSGAPITMGDWKPKDFTRNFKGTLPLKKALYLSKNVQTIHLALDLDKANIIQHARNLGMKARIPDDYTLALGSGSVTLDEMVRTYAIFLNGGKLRQPFFITKIEDPTGKVLERHYPSEPKQVLDPESSFLIVKTLQDVVLRGTATSARVLGRPTAGKTGTTNNYTDAWFIGFTPQLMTGVFVGNDDIRETLGNLETGSRAALPIWLEFMQKALSTEEILTFPQPPGIVIEKIVPETGLLDCHENPNAESEYFKVGTAPIVCDENLNATLNAPDEEESDEGGAESEAMGGNIIQEGPKVYQDEL